MPYKSQWWWLKCKYVKLQNSFTIPLLEWRLEWAAWRARVRHPGTSNLQVSDSAASYKIPTLEVNLRKLSETPMAQGVGVLSGWEVLREDTFSAHWLRAGFLKALMHRMGSLWQVSLRQLWRSHFPAPWWCTWEGAGTSLSSAFLLRFPLFLKKESSGMTDPSVAGLLINNRIINDEDPAARWGAMSNKGTGEILGNQS